MDDDRTRECPGTEPASLFRRFFGGSTKAAHNYLMNQEKLHPHVPCCQLPLEVGFLLLMAYTFAAYDLLPWAPNEAELAKAFTEIWDRERLAPDDIADLLSSGRLKELLIEYAERQSCQHMQRP